MNLSSDEVKLVLALCDVAYKYHGINVNPVVTALAKRCKTALEMIEPPLEDGVDTHEPPPPKTKKAA